MVHSGVLSLQRGEVTSRWRLEKRALLREGTTERSQEWSEGPSPSPRSASKPKQTSLARCLFHLRLGTRRLEALTTLSLSHLGAHRRRPGRLPPAPSVGFNLNICGRSLSLAPFSPSLLCHFYCL